MSVKISSNDPDAQRIIDLIYAYSNAELGEALSAWNKPRHRDDFFMAASNKQGRSIIRLLKQHGFSCSERVLSAAIEKKSYLIATALVPATQEISRVPPMHDWSNRLVPHPLLHAIALGHEDLAHAIFDRPMKNMTDTQKANTCLHVIAASRSKSKESADLVPWLVEKGANPSCNLLSKHYCALGYVMSMGHLEFAHALMDAGANPLNLSNARLSLATALYRSMGQGRRISEAGWELAERMLALGVNMPAMEGKGFAGFGNSYEAKLHPDDIQRVERMRDQFDLNDQTPTVQASRSGPRL